MTTAVALGNLTTPLAQAADNPVPQIGANGSCLLNFLSPLAQATANPIPQIGARGVGMLPSGGGGGTIGF